MTESRVEIIGKLLISVSSLSNTYEKSFVILSAEEANNLRNQSEYLQEVISLGLGNYHGDLKSKNEKIIKSTSSSSSSSLTSKSNKKRLVMEEITLIEENPYDASNFLKFISSTPITNSLSITWNENWAKLSAKWIIPRYVEYFSKMIEADLKKYSTIKPRMLVCVGFSSCGFPEGDGLYLPKENPLVPSSSIVYSHAINGKIEIRPYFDEAGYHLYKIDAMRRDGHYYKKLRDFTYGPCPVGYPIEKCSGIWTSSSSAYDHANLRITSVPESNHSLSIEDQMRFVAIINVIFSHICYQQSLKSREQLIKFLAEHCELCEEFILDKVLSKTECIHLITTIFKSHGSTSSSYNKLFDDGSKITLNTTLFHSGMVVAGGGTTGTITAVTAAAMDSDMDSDVFLVHADEEEEVDSNSSDSDVDSTFH